MTFNSAAIVTVISLLLERGHITSGLDADDLYNLFSIEVFGHQKDSRGVCNSCRKLVGVTKKGKLRRHKGCDNTTPFKIIYDPFNNAKDLVIDDNYFEQVKRTRSEQQQKRVKWVTEGSL